MHSTAKRRLATEAERSRTFLARGFDEENLDLRPRGLKSHFDTADCMGKVMSISRRLSRVLARELTQLRIAQPSVYPVFGDAGVDKLGKQSF